MRAPGLPGGAATDYEQETLAAKNRGKNGGTSMDILPAKAGWLLKTQSTCYNVLCSHIPAPRMTSLYSTILGSNA